MIVEEEAVAAALERVVQELVIVGGHDDEEPSRIVEAWTNAVIGDVVRDDVAGRADRRAQADVPAMVP